MIKCGTHFKTKMEANFLSLNYLEEQMEYILVV